MHLYVMRELKPIRWLFAIAIVAFLLSRTIDELNPRHLSIILAVGAVLFGVDRFSGFGRGESRAASSRPGGELPSKSAPGKALQATSKVRN